MKPSQRCEPVPREILMRTAVLHDPETQSRPAARKPDAQPRRRRRLLLPVR